MKKRLMEMWVIITADPKKASVLGVLGLVALLMWARAAILTGPSDNAPGPRQAVAAQSGSASAIASRDREQYASDRRTLPALTPLQRNLFLPNERYFPLPSQTEAPEPTPAKSLIRNDDKEQVDEAALAARHEQHIREQAERFRVRSIMLGSNPTAVIEKFGSTRGAAQVLRIGQQLDGFTLVEVHRSRVVLEQDGIRVALTLATP